MENFRDKKTGRFKKGEHPFSFKGGFTSKRGYVFTYCPEHPFATGRKIYVMEHRLVMEKHIGRYLTSKEQVHHKNKNRADNRIENLHLCKNDAEHKKLHRKEYKFKKKCSWCRKVKSLKHFQLKKGRPYSWCYACIYQKTKNKPWVLNRFIKKTQVV